jgi:glycosyltransferase involved in cell wall biosynthesis
VSKAPVIALDVRANHDTGVARYGRSLIAAAVPMALARGWRVEIICERTVAGDLRGGLRGEGVGITAISSREGFVRRSTEVRRLLLDRGVELYYTSHYTVDRHCPVPFALTIHDLTRLRYPHLSYTETSFAQRFSTAELSVLRTEIEALAPWDTEEQDRFHRYFAALNRFLVARARRIFTVSETSKGDIVSILGGAPEQVTVVPAGLDQRVFQPQGPKPASAATAQPGPYLLFVGLAHAHKRFDWIVQHLLSARDTFPPGTRLLVTGGHAERDHAVRAALSRDAAGFVQFLGRVEDRELAALYRGASALLSASLSEGSNLPAQEALACGCPVIATDIQAHRETLGRDVLLFRGDDGEMFLRLVRRALSGRLPRTIRIGPSWEVSARSLIDGLAATLTEVRAVR